MALVTLRLLQAPDRFALLHGDYRLDNLLFDGDRVAVVDGRPSASVWPGATWPTSPAPVWNPTCVPRWRRNSSAVSPALGEQGVTGYDQSTCWHDYRLGMIQVPLISALGCAFAIESERGDDMMAAMLRRGCWAIRDLGTRTDRIR